MHFYGPSGVEKGRGQLPPYRLKGGPQSDPGGYIYDVGVCRMKGNTGNPLAHGSVAGRWPFTIGDGPGEVHVVELRVKAGEAIEGYE